MSRCIILQYFRRNSSKPYKTASQMRLSACSKSGPVPSMAKDLFQEELVSNIVKGMTYERACPKHYQGRVPRKGVSQQRACPIDTCFIRIFSFDIFVIYYYIAALLTIIVVINRTSPGSFLGCCWWGGNDCLGKPFGLAATLSSSASA